MSGASPVDYDSSGDIDRIIDTVYAGDLLGQMWKFDVSDANEAKWTSAFSHKDGAVTVFDPLFTARGPSGNTQPITIRPEVGVATGTTTVGDVMLYFGTGKYFETGDNLVISPADVESVYGILDDGTRITSTDRSLLVEQTIEVEGTTSGSEVRALSDNTVDYSAYRGWYLDLVSPNDGAQGERIVERMQLSSGYLIYVTLIPSADVCEFGGNSWLMIVDPETGGSLGLSVFDLNSDNLYDSGDYVTDASTGTDVAVSGKKMETGIVSAPAVISGGDVSHLVTSGTDTTEGDKDGIDNETISSSDESTGRGSWRQLR